MSKGQGLNHFECCRPLIVFVFLSGAKCCQINAQESPLNVSRSTLAAASCSEQADLKITRRSSCGPYKIAKSVSQTELEEILAAFVKLRDDMAKLEAEKQKFYAEERKRDSKNAEIWAEQSIRNTVNEILLRVSGQRPKSTTDSDDCKNFSPLDPHDFRRLKHALGTDRSMEIVTKALDSLVDHRNMPVHWKMHELNKRVLVIQKLFDRHSNLQGTFSEQYTVIQNYESLKSLFPDRFQDL